MKKDQARKQTDKQLKSMEKYLSNMYDNAKLGLQEKWDAYMRDIAPKLDMLKKEYEAAKKSGDKDLIAKLGKEYGIAVRENTLTNSYYKNMIDSTTTRIANVNQHALDYVNGNMASIYSINYNQIASSFDKIAGYSFNMVDESTVRFLAISNKSLLPYKTLNIAKDKAWNTKAINSQVMQGILQGESVHQIANRLENVIGMNANSAIRNARTMTTSAENKGRLDSYKQAIEDGIIMTKIWMATNDDRTRESHAELDGEEVQVDEAFSNGLMYPGDPNGEPEEVYNCRCTMVTSIKGFKNVN